MVIIEAATMVAALTTANPKEYSIPGMVASKNSAIHRHSGTGAITGTDEAASMTGAEALTIEVAEVVSMITTTTGAAAIVATGSKDLRAELQAALPFFFSKILHFSFLLYATCYMNKKKFITISSTQTKKLGEKLAGELCGGEIICLSGDLGAGKTTFTQGLLKGLKIKGPYTSPTFGILKVYRKMHSTKRETQNDDALRDPRYAIHDIYHIDAYRITSKDLFELGWQDFAGKPGTATIIEWPEKVKKLIPTSALWINFEWVSEKERKITLSTKK